MKTALKILGLIFTGMVLVAEINYEMAAEQAVKADSDAEIIKVMDQYGFRIQDTITEITPFDKFQAVITRIRNENK